MRKNREIAAILDCHLRHVTNLKQEKDYPGNDAPEKELVEWYENRKFRKASTVEDARAIRDKLVKEQAALCKTKRLLAEIELKIKTDGLVPMGDAKEAIYKALLAAKIQFEALGSRIAAQCNPIDSDLAKQTIDDAVRQIFEGLQNCE